MDIKQKIGNRIKYFRELHNITQQQLSENVDTTVETIYNCESGRKISIQMVERIADALSIPIAELFQFEEINNKNEKLLNQIHQLCSDKSEKDLEMIKDFIILIEKYQ
jgi:transcriptional regulator with XRE-family HTH domain